VALAVRTHYTYELEQLQQQLLRLVEIVDQAIGGAVRALVYTSAAEAQFVIDGDGVIDELRYVIEEHAIQIIARQHPLAGDLRVISAVMILASELERIGDYAEGIAQIVLRGMAQPRLEIPPELPQMAAGAREMLRLAIQAMIDRDVRAAGTLNRADDEIDALYQKLVQDLLATMRSRPEQSESATYLLWIAHNLERVADRTVNIAERAIYVVTGAIVPVR
jgi:phosphate transport system protein